MKCGCGKLTYKNTIWCEKCYKQQVSNFQQLYKTLSKQHRGAGGAAICICGAVCRATQKTITEEQLREWIRENLLIQVVREEGSELKKVQLKFVGERHPFDSTYID